MDTEYIDYPAEIQDLERSRDVLVLDDSGTYHIAFYDYDELTWYSDQEGRELDRIVSWTPLEEVRNMIRLNNLKEDL